MQDTNGKALKSGIWYTIANFIVRSMSFITTPIFARLLTQEDFGQYNNFAPWLATMTVIITLNLEASFISAKFDFKEKFDEYIFSMLALSGFSGFVWLLVVNLFPNQLSQFTGVTPVYLNLLVMYLILLPAINLFQTRERFAYQYKSTVIISLLVAVSTTALSVALVIFGSDKLFGRIYGSLAPVVIVGTVLYIFLWRKGKRIRFKYWAYALPICLPFIPHLLSLNLLNSMDRIMITKICGAEDNALYSLAYNCGAIVTILATSMNSAFAPWLGNKLNENSFDEIKSVATKYVYLFFALAIGIMLVSPEILWIMGDDGYMEAAYVMPPVAFGCLCQFLYTMYVNVEQFKKKTIGMAFASVSAALLNYILNSIFIPQYGYIVAAYTTLVSYLWLLIVHMLLVKHLGFSHIYPLKHILIILGSMSLITVAVNLLYQYPIVRYSIFVIYVVIIGTILWKYKKEIMAFLARRKHV